MAGSASCLPEASSGKKVSVEHTSVIRGNRKTGKKDSRRSISCKDLGNGEYEGWMWSKKEKSGFGPNSWRNYWFMLKDKSLYCYKDPRDVVARRLYHLPAFVVSVARETSRKYAFKISHESFGTVLFATKDDKDMSNWMTHLINSCEDICKRKKSDESNSDISESDNEEDNIEEEEKKSLQPVTERDDETEDKDLTCADPTIMCLPGSSAAAAAEAAVSSSSAASEIKSMPLESTPCNSESEPERSSIPESISSSSSKEELTPVTASQQEPSQQLHPQSNSVHLASPELKVTQPTSDALEPKVAAKKARGPATPSRPKPSPKSSPPGESSASSPTLQRPSPTRPTCAPATYAKPARAVPLTGERSSTSAASSEPVALAMLAHQAASFSKPLRPVTGVAAEKLLRTSDAVDGSAKTPFEMPSKKNANTGPGTYAKPSSTNTAITAPCEVSAVASVPSLPGRAITGPIFSASRSSSSSAVSSTRACSAEECSTTQVVASKTKTKNFGPLTFAKPSAILRAVSETLPPNWNVSDPTLSSMPTASAARSSAMSSSNGNNTSPSSEAHFCIVKSPSVQKEEARLSAVTSLSDTFQTAEALSVFSATKRAHARMTNIAKSMKIKAKPSPANRYEELCSHLFMLQRSFKDKMQELQILEELLKTPEMTSGELKQFCHENRDFAKRLTGSSMVLGESLESDTENRLEDM